MDHYNNPSPKKQVRRIICPFAAMAELADALDSGSSRGNSVDVQIILAAKIFIEQSLKNTGTTELLHH